MKFSVHLILTAGLLALAALCPGKTVAQCSSLIAVGSCTGGNGAASNNININAGQTYWFTGSGTFGNGVNMNGGTLRVCGTLVFNNISFNSGTILIEAGGSLTINGGGTLTLNGNSIIQNRGTLTINRNVTMQNANNRIVNATTGAVLNMNSGAYQLQINSSTSKFVNNGVANINNIFVQGSGSAGAVCLGPGSCTNLTSLTNNFTNGFNAPNGPASLRYTGNALLNNNLASNNDVLVCKATGATTSGGAGWGGAQVFNNCSSCASLLPMDLVYFQARTWSGYVVLDWQTSMEKNNKAFHIERSTDGKTWNEVGSLPGSGSTGQLSNYTWTDISPLPGESFYRLRQEDYDGTSSYGPVQKVVMDVISTGFKVHPNPAHDRITVDLSTDALKMDLLDVYGRRLRQINATRGTNTIQVNDLSPGTYIFRAGSQVTRFIKE